MEDDDHKHLYEVNEMQDYDQLKGFQPSTGHDIKLHQIQQPVFSVGKAGSVILTVAILLILVALVIIIALSGLTITQYNTCPANCDGSAQLGASTSGLPNCSVVSNTWADQLAQNNTMLQWQVNLMAQNNTMLQWQVNQLLAANNQSICSVPASWTDGVAQDSALLQQKVDQLVNMTKDTSDRVNWLQTAADNQTNINRNLTDTLQWVYQTTGDSAQRLINIVNTLSNIKDTGTSTAGVVDDILLVVDQLYQIQNGSTGSLLPTSCEEIKQKQPNSPSGVYLLAHPHGGSATYTYCEMGPLCNSSGPWTRVAYLDMSDATVNCPPGFRFYLVNGVRACGRPWGGPSCPSVQFPINGIGYTEICGRVTGYQYSSPDAVAPRGGYNNINSWYVDGVSITRGSPREHVWTLMGGVSDTYVINPYWICPCSPGSNQNIQSFVGDNYFCESGNHNNYWQGRLYTSDPLWDGQGCGSNEGPCCAAPGLPWFYRDYGNATSTAFLELRVCGNQHTGDEDTPVGFYEIYVK